MYIVLFVRLVLTIILILALCLALIFSIKKGKRSVKISCAVISFFLVFALISNFSNIYVFNISSEDASVIADTLNEKLNTVTFNVDAASYYSTVQRFEDSFEYDGNRYSIDCKPFDGEIYDLSYEGYYALAREFQYDNWNILIAPTVYFFESFYYIGFHGTPTHRILCYNDEVRINLMYFPREDMFDKPWEDIDFDMFLQHIVSLADTWQ